MCGPSSEKHINNRSKHIVLYFFILSLQKEPTMTKLKAHQGTAFSIRLDDTAKEQLKHLRLFIATKMDLQVSDSVLIRRALNMLTKEYDKLVRASWIKGKEHKLQDESLSLASASSGSYGFTLEPIDILEKFPTWQQRIDSIKQLSVMDIIEEQEEQHRKATKSFYQQVK